MQLGFNGMRFVLACAFSEREIAKESGFRWDQFSKYWYTTNLAVAIRLRKHADSEAEKEFKRALISVEPWAGRIVYPAHLTPLPFQLDGVKFALERNRSYLAFDPGLGKTPIAAMIAATLNQRAVFICPPFMVANVYEEFKKWHTPPIIFPDSTVFRPEVVDSVKHLVSEDRRKGFKPLLFVDEAHRFKNHEAKRTKAVFQNVVPLFDRVVFLSGTPMPNRPIELFPVLTHCAPETIGFKNKMEYGKRYCKAAPGQWGWDFSGADNLQELAANVIGKFMMRVRKRDVLNLPMTEEIVILNTDMPAKLGRLDKTILKRYSPADLMHKVLSLEINDGQELHLSSYRREIGAAKLDEALKFIKAQLEETEENFLVFAIHKEVIAGLARELREWNPLVITGATPMAERQTSVKTFQQGRSRLLIGNIQAAGTGFTLTKATRVVFVEFSWVPGDNQQAADRACRIGQESNVHCQFLVFKNSIDKTVLETVLNKRQITEEL